VTTWSAANSPETRADNSKTEIAARLVAAARDMVPALRERAADIEARRTIPTDVIEQFVKAGFFKVLQPARYGGYELDYGAIQLDLAGEIGRGCGSSAWVMTVLTAHSWMLGMLPQEAQDDVWAGNPDALICSGVIPENGCAEPRPGGVSVSGQWRFSSGVDHAQWALLGVPLVRDNTRQMIWILVPREDFSVEDGWFVSGMRGTGSKDLTLSDVFVPEHRTASLADPLADRIKISGQANIGHIYRLPLFAVFPYNICAPALGIARGAIEHYRAGMKAKFSRQPASPPPPLDPLLLRFAEATAQVDAAAALLYQNAQELNEQMRLNHALSVEQGARYARDLSFATRLFTQAVENIAYASGAHGLFDSSPIQRALRDIQAVNVHIGLRWEARASNYVRAAVGLEPNATGR
jgi:alkylation response protein AidB-like acyl-CoA dehydrogenase